MKRYLLIAFFGFVTIIHPSIATAQYQLDSTILDSTLIIDGLDIPWEIQWGPDDWIWCTERYGRVSRIDPLSGTQDVILDLSSDVGQFSESGLLGLQLHPDFANEPWVYLVYTYGNAFNLQERMVRYWYDGTNLINPDTIIDGIPGETTHDGSRLLVLADSTLLMTTGDAQIQSLPQNTSSMNGKFLRFNLDGSIPSDNPWPTSPVYTWGHRNPQGIVQHPNGRIYSSEHGPSNDDELNIIESGRNYGWPNVEGYCDLPSDTAFCNDSSVYEPIYVWYPQTSTIAPSDLVWYDHPSIPEFQNKLLMTVLKNKRVISIELDAAGTSVVGTPEDWFINEFQRLRDICVDPNGTIYLATSGSSWNNNNPFTHEIIALRNTSYVASPEVVVSDQDGFVIAPNPVRSVCTLNFSQHLIGETFQLIDITGKVLRTERITSRSMKLLRLGLASGTYFVSVQKDGNPISKPLVFR